MNEKFAHTPGPWSFDTSDRTILGEDRSLAITTVDCFDRGGNKGFFFGQESEANARLIAAAPTMLDALHAAEEALVNSRPVMEHYPEAVARHDQALLSVRAAIAKALGKTSEAA